MPYNESRKNITSRYRKKHDMIQISVKLGEKEIISQHAKERGESVNGFINRAIKETIVRDSHDKNLEG